MRVRPRCPDAPETPRHGCEGAAPPPPRPAAADPTKVVPTDGNDGNPTTIVDSGTAVHDRVHNARHQLLNNTVAGVTRHCQHDDNGNLRHDGVRSYAWDFKNRLVQVNETSVVRAYQCDADNGRIVSIEPGNVTRFVLDGKHEIEHRTGTGHVLRQVVYGPGIDEAVLVDVNRVPATPVAGVPVIGPVLSNVTDLLRQEGVTSKRHDFHLDDQHTTIALTNATGHVAEGYEYTPYGLPIIDTPGANGNIDWGGTSPPCASTGRRAACDRTR